MKLLALAIVLIIFMPMPVLAQESLVLRLRLNNTDSMVYIPNHGTGEVASSGLGPETLYSQPEHFFIGSYISGLLTGLASGTARSLITESGSGYHVIGMGQSFGKPVYLALTSGDWQPLSERAPDLESGSFMDFVSPSFAYGLGTYHPLRVAASYPGIDIRGSIETSRGIYKLLIENMGHGGGRPIVSVRSV
jgi:hypothetical protein